MMKNTIVALLISGTFAATALAADQGFYVGANVGQSSTDTYSLSTKTGTTFSLLGGYQFMRYVAAEVQYNDFGSPTVQGGTSTKLSGYSAAAVGTLPFNDQWSLLGRVGFASTKIGSPVDNSKSDITYGIGGQYNINQALGVRIHYDQYKTDNNVQTATTSVASAGVVYKF